MKFPIRIVAGLFLLSAWPLRSEVTILWQPPENASVPLNRESRLAVEAEGSGALSYQWFKNGNPLPGGDEAQVALAAFNSEQTNRYQVRITDADSTVWSNEISLTAFDVAEQLGLPGHTFVFEDTPSQQYYRMIPEEGEGVSLATSPYFPQLEPYRDRPAALKLYLPEPAVVTFSGKGNLTTENWAITIFSQSKPDVPGLGLQEWYRGAQKVEGEVPYIVEWSTFTIVVRGTGFGDLKDVYIQKTPFLYGPITSGSTTRDYETRMEVHLASIGETTVKLLREEEIVLEETSEDNLTALLRWTPASTEETGQYTVVVENEHGPVESDPFEIFVGEHPLEGMDNEELYYAPTNSGHILPSIWHTQREETFDGVDAVGWKAGQDSNTKNFLQVGIREPVLISFWYKSPALRVTTEYQDLDLAAENWTQCKILVTQAPDPGTFSFNNPNILEFRTDSEETFLDQLKIDRLRDDPFKAWIYPRFLDSDQPFEADTFASEDYDNDRKSNLLEWLLNSDPLAADGIPRPQVESIGGNQYAYFSFESPADLGSYTYLLESCTDLSTWKPVEVEETNTPIAGTVRVLRKVRDLAPLEPGQKRFYRLSIGS